MIRRILILTALIATSVYLVLAVTVFNAKPTNRECKSIELEIKDNTDLGFVTLKDIETSLKQKKLSLVGKALESIDTRAIENTLEKNSFVKNAECYITSGGKLKIDIYQRIPMMRVISSNGDNYYIDNEGKIMNANGKAVRVTVATGYIDRKFAQDKLFELAKFLKSDYFWDSQIEQINITTKQEIELIPRVGDHVLFIGKPEMYEIKFRKLKAFYKEALNNVGWNKYERISVEFNNQIICTKKER